jgi:hypothetical protein
MQRRKEVTRRDTFIMALSFTVDCGDRHVRCGNRDVFGFSMP